MIFSKNPILGKVKTRLARSVGDEKALEIYRLLLKHTRDITKPILCDRVVYYSDFINCEDLWSHESFLKKKQTGQDLGERMANAFKDQLNEHKSCVIIGTDCYESYL
jgi:hypothetical protein